MADIATPHKLYSAAVEYLKNHLNGRTTLPEKAWKTEREKLLKERFSLAEQYYNLKADVKNVEVLRRGAESFISDIEPEQGKARMQELEL